MLTITPAAPAEADRTHTTPPEAAVSDTALTDKQQQIYAYIRKTIETKGFPPAIRDICEAFGISSPNGVMCHLKALQKKGYINRVEKRDNQQRAQARGITIPGVSAGGFSLPLKGVVAAGRAIEAEETDDRLEMRELFGEDDLYVVKVKGQSMIDGHIADGDYVVIRKRETCENGDKVVAMVDRAMTLKKYQRKKDQILLHPMNAAMEPIVVDPARQDVQILGLLAGVIRKC
ncbi:LexA repressor [Urbifossiella limnaea]|uniref:LexA repressor n=1 Tax=Urbifossiella limnaea TaxID=2528023 RepID=A0A517XRU3_9BACT|nr:LexA repressor [Urbifossiella limnaea]